MKICTTKDQLKTILSEHRKKNEQISFVPTMGALHEGHLSLIDLAKKSSDCVVASIFVNHLQFSEGEDLDEYPRQMLADQKLLEGRGCDILFAPGHSDLFDDDFSTHIRVEGITQNHCGATRPNFFGGIATIVTKLLMIVSPHMAVFGEKDFQQLAMIKRLVRDLDIPVDILGGATVRESDGLAMSSRNQYLSKKDRAVAPLLQNTLKNIVDRVYNEDISWQDIHAEAIAHLNNAGFTKIDYIDLVDSADLSMIDDIDAIRQGKVKGRLLAAAWIGKTRLIDNIAI